MHQNITIYRYRYVRVVDVVFSVFHPPAMCLRVHSVVILMCGEGDTLRSLDFHSVVLPWSCDVSDSSQLMCLQGNCGFRSPRS